MKTRPIQEQMDEAFAELEALLSHEKVKVYYDDGIKSLLKVFQHNTNAFLRLQEHEELDSHTDGMLKVAHSLKKQLKGKVTAEELAVPMNKMRALWEEHIKDIGSLEPEQSPSEYLSGLRYFFEKEQQKENLKKQPLTEHGAGYTSTKGFDLGKKR